MSITVNSVLISDEYNGNQNGGADPGLSYLLGEIGDKEWGVYTFEVNWMTSNVSLTTNTANKTITRNDCPGPTNSGSFIADGFNQNDTVVLAGTSTNDGTYTIKSITATVMTFNENLSVNGTWSSGNVYGNTPILAMDYYMNLVPNNFGETFQSLSDNPSSNGNIQKFSASWSSTPANVSMIAVGASQAWSAGNIPVINYVGQGQAGYLSPYSRRYTITHPFLIKPFALSNHIQALKSAYAGNPQPPDFWQGDNCFKLVYKINARYTSTSPTVYHTSDPQNFPLGNTGWFNEFLNGGVSTYTLTSIAYKNHSTGAAMSQIDWNVQTDFTIVLASTFGVFTAQHIPFVLNFIRVPTNPSEYQNTTTNFRQDFLHDRVFAKTSNAGVNGDQFGTGYQILTNVVGTYNNAYQITITGTINMGATAKSTFNNAPATDCNYVIWVTPQNVACTTLATTDRVAVLCDVNTAQTNTDDSTGLIVITDGTTDTHLFRYPNVDVNPVTNFTDFIGSYSYARNDFLIKSYYKLQTLTVTIKATQSGFQDTVLEQQVFNCDGTFDGVKVNPSININRNFPIGGNYATISLNRYPSLDGFNGLNGYAYRMIYGFQLGYRDWISLVQFDPSLEATAWQYWASYSNAVVQPSLGSGWQLVMNLQWVVIGTNGVSTTFSQSVNLSAADTTNNGTASVAFTTQDNLGNDLGGVVTNQIQTQITATITCSSMSSLDPPAPYSTAIGKLTFWYDDGSQQAFDISTTEQANETGSYWVGQPVVTRISATQYTIVGLLDLTQETLPLRSYRIYAQLAYKI